MLKAIKALLIASIVSIMFLIICSIGAVGFCLFVVISLCWFIYKLSNTINQLIKKGESHENY